MYVSKKIFYTGHYSLTQCCLSFSGPTGSIWVKITGGLRNSSESVVQICSYSTCRLKHTQTSSKMVITDACMLVLFWFGLSLLIVHRAVCAFLPLWSGVDSLTVCIFFNLMEKRLILGCWISVLWRSDDFATEQSLLPFIFFTCWSLCFWSFSLLLCFLVSCYWSECHFCFVCRCWSLFTPTLQPDYKLFCTLRFYFAHLIGSPVTLTAQRLWHILTLYRSLPSPLCLFTSPSLSALALCLSAVVSLCSGPIRRPAVDPESLESDRFSLSDDVLVVHSLSSISVGILKPTV